MKQGTTRYLKEDFGFIAVFPSGRVFFLDHSASGYLRPDSSEADLASYKLKDLKVPRSFHLSAPLLVWLELTRNCNLRCMYCFTSAGEPLPGELTREEIFHVMEEMAGMGVVGLVLTGGEPTMHPHIHEIVERAAELGFVISLATNGLNLDDAFLERFPKKESFICLSLDGFETQKHIRRGSTQEFVREKLDLLDKHGIQSSIMTTISHANIKEVVPLVKWARSRGIVLRTVPFMPMGRGEAFKEELCLRGEDLENAAMVWALETEFELEKNKEYAICIGHLYDFCLSFVHNSRRCQGGRTLAYINSAGVVYPCSNCSGDKVFPAGNIRENTFSHIWKNSFNDIRSVIWDDFRECKYCELSGPEYFCTNRCPMTGMKVHGKPNSCGAREFDKRNLKLRTLYLKNILQGKEITKDIDPVRDSVLKKIYQK